MELITAPHVATLLLGLNASGRDTCLLFVSFMLLASFVCVAFGQAGQCTSSRQLPLDDYGSSSTEKTRPNKRRRKKGNGGSDGNGGNGGNGGRGLKGTVAPRPANESPRRNLACPFFRLNPLHYLNCASYDLADYDAVKKHLQRKHRAATDYYCPRCYLFFGSEDDKDQHIRDNLCTTVDGYDTITNAEWDSVHDRRQPDACPWASDNVRKWLWLWRRLFPGHAPPSEELVYLQDAATEAMRPFGPEAFLSALQAYFSSQTRTLPEMAVAIREGVMRNVMHAGREQRPYRRYLNSNRAQRSSSSSSSNGNNDNINNGQVAEPAGTDAELLSPVTRFLLAGQQADLPGQDSLSPLVVVPPSTPNGEGAFDQPHQAAGGNDDMDVVSIPQDAPNPSINPALLQDPSAHNTDVVWIDASYQRPMMTAAEIWKCMHSEHISSANPNSPMWSDSEVTSCIDWQMLVKCIPSLVVVSIPILRDRLDHFRAMEARGLADPENGVDATWDITHEGDFMSDEEI